MTMSSSLVFAVTAVLPTMKNQKGVCVGVCRQYPEISIFVVVVVVVVVDDSLSIPDSLYCLELYYSIPRNNNNTIIMMVMA